MAIGRGDWRSKHQPTNQTCAMSSKAARMFLSIQISHNICQGELVDHPVGYNTFSFWLVLSPPNMVGQIMIDLLGYRLVACGSERVRSLQSFMVEIHFWWWECPVSCAPWAELNLASQGSLQLLGAIVDPVLYSYFPVWQVSLKYSEPGWNPILWVTLSSKKNYKSSNGFPLSSHSFLKTTQL